MKLYHRIGNTTKLLLLFVVCCVVVAAAATEVADLLLLVMLLFCYCCLFFDLVLLFMKYPELYEPLGEVIGNGLVSSTVCLFIWCFFFVLFVFCSIRVLCFVWFANAFLFQGDFWHTQRNLINPWFYANKLKDFFQNIFFF